MKVEILIRYVMQYNQCFYKHLLKKQGGDVFKPLYLHDLFPGIYLSMKLGSSSVVGE